MQSTHGTKKKTQTLKTKRQRSNTFAILVPNTKYSHQNLNAAFWMLGPRLGGSSALTKRPFRRSIKKIFTSKYSTPDEIKLELPPNKSSRQHNMEHFTSIFFDPSSYLNSDNSDLTFNSSPDKPFSKAAVAYYTH